MLKTDNYELNIAQGTDIVNPLVMDNPNYQKIDKVMKDNEIRGIGIATELKTGSIHAITVPAQYTTFKFVATSDFVAGETFTLNGKQVTGYTTNQQPLTTNAYRIGATVLCSYIERSSTITLYTIAPAGKAEDSEQLDGHPASYFAVRGNTNQTLEQVNTVATSRGTLAQTALSNQKSTVLWENNEVSSSFTGKKINIDFMQYKMVMILFEKEAGYPNDILSIMTFVNENTRYYINSINNAYINMRSFLMLSDGILFDNGLEIRTLGSYGANNNNLIPYKVIGILK